MNIAIVKEVNDKEIVLPVLASKEYLKALKTLDYGYIYDASKHIVLPFYLTTKLVFRIASFTTGVINAQTDREEELFLESAFKYLHDRYKIDFILPNAVTALFNVAPKNVDRCRFGSYILDLKKSEDELFLGFHSKHRNVVRKAIKDGCTIHVGIDCLEDAISLVNTTLSRQGVKGVLETYYKQLCLDIKSNVLPGVVYSPSGQLDGAAIVFWKEHSCAYYVYGGSSSSPYTGAMNFLQWEIIKQLKSLGVFEYDFVGARISPERNSKFWGIQMFKERFGGELKEGFLLRVVFSKYKYFLFNLLLKLNYFIRGIKYKGDIVSQENRRGL